MERFVARIKILLRRHERKNTCVKTPEGTIEQRWEEWEVLLSCEEGAPSPSPEGSHADALSAGSCWGMGAGNEVTAHGMGCSSPCSPDRSVS